MSKWFFKMEILDLLVQVKNSYPKHPGIGINANGQIGPPPPRLY